MSPTKAWCEPVPITVPEEILELTGNQHLVAETLVRRGLDTKETAFAFLFPESYQPTDPDSLPDLSLAAQRIQSALNKGETIGVWGDYDVDGQTSTAILVEGLSSLGAKVEYYIPVRSIESHGVNISSLKRLLAKNIDLLITCDTGISAHEAVDFAAAHHVDTIITDHHTLPPELPAAYAVVNPRRLPVSHPLYNLCGAGCAFKLLEELFIQSNQHAQIEHYFDLAALGTIADLANLTQENRFLVQQGLRKLQASDRPGLNILMELAGISPPNLTEETVGFGIAPRLNAMGRLSDANQIVELLISNDVQKLRPIAANLEILNEERKLLTNQVLRAAQTLIDHDRCVLDFPILSLSHADWPGGIIGIVANQLVEIYQKPVLLISQPPEGTARGTARSIEGVNITDAITENQEFLTGFGGHPMAAGFSLPTENVTGFCHAVGNSVQKQLKTEKVAPELQIDAFVPFENIDLEFADSLNQLSPFGTGNPPLVIASQKLTIRNYSVIGKNKNHLQMTIESPGGTVRKVLWWKGADQTLPENEFDMAYHVRSSSFQGHREVQIEWVDSRPGKDLISPTVSIMPFNILDLRSEESPEKALQKIYDPKLTIIWGEGRPDLKFPMEDRFHLERKSTLIILTIPPERSILQSVLQIVNPLTVYLFGLNPAFDKFAPFLRQLSGLTLYVINKLNGRGTINDFISVTAQREITIIKGLEWLQANGNIQYSREENGLNLSRGGQISVEKRDLVEKDIKALLDETAAYRSFYLRSDPKLLLQK